MTATAKKKRAAEDKQGVPTWIVSFSDMITLLLAFFVLLQAFAQDQDPELFFRGQGSFRRAIAGLGIPDWLYGKEDKPEYGHTKSRHTTDEDESDPARQRILNARDEDIRQRFRQLTENMRTETADVRQEAISVEATPILFDGPGGDLNDAARTFLDRFAMKLKDELRSRQITLYVVGLAADQPAGRDRWLASARRATAVDNHLRELLDPMLAGGDWQLHSWGAAGGRNWCKELGVGVVDKQTAIVIAVMGAGNGRR